MTLKSRIETIIEAKHSEIFTPIITAAIVDAIENEDEVEEAITTQLEAMAVNWALVKQIYGALDTPIGSPQYVLTSKVFADSPYTLLESDYFIECDCTSGAIDIILPTLIVGKKYIIKKIDATANKVNIIGTVEGTVNPTLLAQYGSASIIGGSGQWLNVP